MRGAFRTFLSSLKVVEVGVSRGDNAKMMMMNLPLAKFYLVDSYDVNNSTFQFSKDGKVHVFTQEERAQFIEEARRNVAEYAGNRCEWFIDDSALVAAKFPDDHFDFVYIDAQHDYDSVKRDIEAWWPKVKKGGFLAGHDYGGDVAKAIQEKFGSVSSGYGSDWWVVK
jgi:hypothetical protein